MNPDLWKPIAKRIIAVMADSRLDDTDIWQISLLIDQQHCYQLSRNIFMLGQETMKQWNGN